MRVTSSEQSHLVMEVADVIWAMQDRNTWSEGKRAQAGNRGHTGFGHYHERYRRVDGQWLISYRRLERIRVEKSWG